MRTQPPGKIPELIDSDLLKDKHFYVSNPEIQRENQYILKGTDITIFLTAESSQSKTVKQPSEFRQNQ